MFVAVMRLDHLQETRWLRSRPTAAGFAADKIDADTGMLYDVVMVEEGEAKGHGVHLDADFVSNLVDYDQRVFSNRGLKARFGHPSASGDTMGTQMGVFSNFRKRRSGGKMQAIADLQLLDSAEDSPTHPGMRSWILKMAAERPDFLMMSIVFKGSGYYQRKPNGHKRRIEEREEWDETQPVFVEFDAEQGADHFYTDLVEQGAATESLFSTKVNPDFFVSRAHEWLDDNPDIRTFVKDNPQRVQFFLQRLGIFIQPPAQKKMSKFSLLKWLSGEPQDAEPAVEDLDTLRAELSAAKASMTALQTAKDALDNRVKEFETQVASLQANVAQLEKDAKALKADLDAKVAEIAALKAEPADSHTGGETEPGSSSLTERPYHQTPIYQKAKTFRRNAPTA